VNLWLDDTHTPWVPGEDQLSGGKARAGNSEANLRRVLTETDKQIGRLLADLRERGSRRQTLVILLGDNGPLPTFGQSRTAGLRGSKLSLYEGGIRVPCIAWWPGQTPAGAINESTVLAAVDFLPSLAAIARTKLPESYESDGEDLSGALRGQSPARARALYWEYGRNDRSFAYPRDPRHKSPNLAVREGRWKLLVQADGSGAQLFDVVADPNETTDLSAQRPEIANRLSEQALAWRKSLPGG
jgi:arylsulfatase A-like enzyme